MFGEKTHRSIYLLLLTLLGGTMLTSVWLANLMWVLLLANWVIEGRWREKWQMACKSRLLQAFVALYLLLVIGLLWTSNLAHGMEVLQVKLPLLVVPVVVLTSRPVEGRARRTILLIYVATVLAVSIVGAVRLVTIPDLPYRDAVPHISHIRFALNCCMAIFIMCGMRTPDRWFFTAGRMLIVGWMLAFLVLLHSYTAAVVLLAVSLVMLLVYWRRWPLIALWVLLVGVAVAVVCIEVKSYYRLVPMATEPLRPTTVAGNPYFHAEDGIIENGNYVNNYICHDEMRREWNRRSNVSFDDGVVATGYAVEPTLVRYLNALGLTKDSVGVCSLTAAQIDAVERGVANPVYESGNPVKKMVYVMLLEREFYVHTHAVLGFTMLQRFELWRHEARIIGDNPWFGVGTGDVDDQLHASLSVDSSELAGTTKRGHNQYLSLIAALGFIGFAVVLFMYLRAIPGMRLSPLMLAWLLTILISCLTEDTLDTLAGILFCTWFLSFRNRQCTNTTPLPTA